MEKIELILRLVYAIIGFTIAAVGFGVAVIRLIKAKKQARSDAEAAKAENEMTNKMTELIQNAEVLYAAVDTALKANGDSAGVVKKDSVMSKLQAFAMSNGYLFDPTYWADKIDEYVKFTKSVNSK